jgi:hypothetical protein
MSSTSCAQVLPSLGQLAAKAYPVGNSEDVPTKMALGGIKCSSARLGCGVSSFQLRLAHII